MTASRKIPAPPAGSGRGGGRYWRDVLGCWELSVTEHQALVLAVVLMGRRENLTAAILRDGDIIEGPQGPKVHPAVSELRQVSATIGRC